MPADCSRTRKFKMKINNQIVVFFKFLAVFFQFFNQILSVHIIEKDDINLIIVTIILSESQAVHNKSHNLGIVLLPGNKLAAVIEKTNQLVKIKKLTNLVYFHNIPFPTC